MKVIKIGALWCNGCLVMRPRWKQVEEENPRLMTEYYDYDESPEIVEKYGIESGRLPEFIFLGRDGKELDRKSGELTKDEIVRLITKYRDM